MKKRLLKVLTIMMCVSMLGLSCKLPAETSVSAGSFSNEAILFSWEEVKNKSFLDLSKDIVIYGKDLDVEYINEQIFQDVKTLKLSDAAKGDTSDVHCISARSSENDRNLNKNRGIAPEDLCDQYYETKTVGAFLVNTGNDKILGYSSISYPKGTNLPLSDEKIKEAVQVNYKDFVSSLFQKDLTTHTKDSSVLVLHVRDYNAVFDYYTPNFNNPPQSFRMRMLDYKVDYYAYKEADLIEGTDYFIIETDVEVTPGNSGLQEYPQFKNAPVVIGVQPNMWTAYSADKLLSGYPDDGDLSYTMTAGSTYNFSIGAPGSFSFGFTWTPGNKVTRTTLVDRTNGVYNNFYGGQNSNLKYCISTTCFTLKCAARFSSIGKLLKINVSTGFKTFFQNESLSDAKWNVPSKVLRYDY